MLVRRLIESSIALHCKYGLNVAAVLHELAYPTKNTLKQWHREYIEMTGYTKTW